MALLVESGSLHEVHTGVGSLDGSLVLVNPLGVVTSLAGTASLAGGARLPGLASLTHRLATGATSLTHRLPGLASLLGALLGLASLARALRHLALGGVTRVSLQELLVVELGAHTDTAVGVSHLELSIEHCLVLVYPLGVGAQLARALSLLGAGNAGLALTHKATRGRVGGGAAATEEGAELLLQGGAGTGGELSLGGGAAGADRGR